MNIKMLENLNLIRIIYIYIYTQASSYSHLFHKIFHFKTFNRCLINLC